MKRRRLGQHYLADREAVRRIIEAAAIEPHERVLEIGTGRGELTRELVGLGSGFEGFEIDEDNYEATVAAVPEARGKIRLGDVFEFRPRFDVLVASLPYSRSSVFIEWLSQLRYGRAVVVLQEDFVKKALAEPGSRDYRGISALAQMASETRVLFRLGRNAFSPPPKVSSLVVRMTPRTRLSSMEILNVKRLFSLRRRKVSSVLVKLGMTGRDYGDRRVYSLLPDEVHSLCSARTRS
jgi:16S rRNA (adenine1518-N6/adenine1519-N6)-dimethyltransferase